MSQLLDYTGKIDKKLMKNRKFIFGSDLSETNNEPIFRLHQTNDKIEKNIEKLFLAHNCVKRILTQLLHQTIERKNSKCLANLKSRNA